MMNDQEALESARRGRPEGFRAILDTYERYVFTLALRFVRDRHLAEDAVQETFTAAFRTISSFRGESRLKTWLYTIVYRVVLRMMDKRRETAELPEALPDPGSSFSSRVDQELDVRFVLDRLPARDRLVLVLSYWDDLNCREIAEIIECTENHVKILLFRARKRFSHLWKTSSGEGGIAA